MLETTYDSTIDSVSVTDGAWQSATRIMKGTHFAGMFNSIFGIPASLSPTCCNRELKTKNTRHFGR